MRHEPYIEPEQLATMDRWCKRFAVWVGVPFAIFLLFIWPGFAIAQEVPRFVQVEYAQGKSMTVRVFDKSCHQGRTGAWASTEAPDWPAVYLCGHTTDERHELDHWRGMRHTAWDEVDRVGCATVTAAGYATTYKVGDRICMTRDTRFEWLEERKTTASATVLRLKQ